MILSASSKKGVAVIWILMLGVLLVMALVFILLDQTMAQVKNATITGIETTDYSTTNTKLETVWPWVLVVCFVSVLSWAVLSTMRRPDG